MDIRSIETSYARWAPIYDRTFGAITNAGRREAVAFVNDHARNVLEVGVGTGLALTHYAPQVRVTGIDASEDMLARARQRATALRLANVAGLTRMDARDMDFPDDHFDAVVAMHIMSVVPEPERVMAEMCRVCAPGGCVVITNHFARDKGLWARLEQWAAPFADLLGWHSDFEMSRVLGEERLKTVQRKSLPPLGMMTFLVLQKHG